MSRPRCCLGCGEAMMVQRSNKSTCSDRCRQTVRRRRARDAQRHAAEHAAGERIDEAYRVIYHALLIAGVNKRKLDEAADRASSALRLASLIA